MFSVIRTVTLLLATAGLTLGASVQAQESITVAGGKQTVSYLLYLPEGYKEKADVKWPLMIFLHGAGERGDDLNRVKGTARLNW